METTVISARLDLHTEIRIENLSEKFGVAAVDSWLPQHKHGRPLGSQQHNGYGYKKQTQFLKKTITIQKQQRKQQQLKSFSKKYKKNAKIFFSV